MEAHWDEHVVFKLLLLMTCLMPNTISEATSGYMGCYQLGVNSGASFMAGQSYNTSKLDELFRCRDDLKFYAAISGHNCLCQNSLENQGTFKTAEDNRCDMFCNGDICGGTNHYSVFNTTTGICPPLMAPVNGAISHILLRVGRNVTFSCLPGYNLIGPMFMHCSMENDTAIWKGRMPTCEPYNQTSIWNSVWVRVVIDVASIVVGSAIIIFIVFAIRSCPRRRRKGRTFTSREDFSMPDCAMSSTLNSEHSPRVMSRGYRNFTMSTLMRNADPLGDFEQGLPDINYDESVTVTEFDVKPHMASTKRRTKQKGGNTSSKTRNSTFRLSTLADSGAEPSVPWSPTTDSKIPQISSSAKSSDGPERLPKPSIEHATMSPLLKSTYTPNVQNAKYESSLKLKSSDVPKRSKKPIFPPPCPKPNTGFAAGKGEFTSSPNIQESENTPSSTGSSQSVLKKNALKNRCKSVFFQNVQKEDNKSMSGGHGGEGNASKTFRNQDNYRAHQSIPNSDAANDSVSRLHDMNSIIVDREGIAVRNEAIQKPSKKQPVVLPRPKFSRLQNRQCMSMQELD